MPFDPSTAKLAFDPSTATASGFNPATARPESDAEFIQRTTPELVNAPAAPSYISRRTGGLVTLPGDPGFETAGRGVAPFQLAQIVGESPEIQALGVRMGSAIPASIMGAEYGASLGPYGALAGGALGGMAGALSAEPLATRITPREETGGEQLANVLQFAIPGGRATTRTGQAILDAAIGAGQGQLYADVQSLADTGRLPSIQEAAPLVLGGTALGGGIGALAGGSGARPLPQPLTGRSNSMVQALSNIEARGVPEELNTIGRVFREPVLPEATDVLPSELALVGSVGRQADAEARAAAMAGLTVEQFRTLQLGRQMAGNLDGGTVPPDQLRPIPDQLPPPTDFPPDEFAAISNIVNPRIPAPVAGIPAELEIMSAVRQAPALPAELPGVPSEFGVMQGAFQQAGREQAGAARVGAVSDEVALRRLAERMAGKTPEQQLEIVQQEVAIQGDTLTPNQQRAALDIEQGLEAQIARKDEIEAGFKAEQKAIADAQAAASTTPEVPKSTQILAENVTKPPSIANVATEVATQTKQSPYALQTKLNEMTAAPAAAVTGVPAPEPAITKAASIKTAIDNPATEWVYTVQRIPDGGKGFVQVDAINPEVAGMERNVVSSNPSDLRAAGADIPDVPDWVPQGQYTREQIEVFIKQGEPVPPVAPFARSVMEALDDEGAFLSASESVREAIDAIPKNLRDSLIEAINQGKSMVESRELLDEDILASLETTARTPKNYAKAIEWLNAFKPKGEPKRALQIEGPSPGLLRPSETAPQPVVELPAMGEGNALNQAPAGEAGGASPQVESRGINPRPPDVTRQASRMRQTRGVVAPQILAPLAGGASGAAYGATQGETPEERVRNAVVYGAIGLGLGGATGAVAKRLTAPPIRNYNSPILKDVAQMLTPKEEKVPLLKRVSDGYNNFRYRFNTRYAPIGQAQRSLFKQTGREFVPDSYYDLERGFERVAGAPVQAEGEVELLQNVLDKLPNKNVQDFDTYLTLSRIEDRLVKTSEENDVLLDAVGRARAEVDAAEAAVKANPTQRGFAALAARREERDAAIAKLKKEYDRKRVGDWSIAKARQGLADLRQHFVDRAASEVANATNMTPAQKQAFAQNQGDTQFAQLQQAGKEFQDVMQRSLQIQVDSGRLDPKLRDVILASNDFYAPFKVLKHYDEDAPFVRGGGTQRIPSQEQLAKRITGIDDTDVRIGSPTSVAAEQVYKGYILAQKNLKMRQLATLSRLDPAGEYVKPLGEGMEPRKGYEAVSYLQNGQSKRLEVARPIADALNGLNANQQDMILNALGRFGGVFKLGATGMSIPFNIANAGIFDPLRLATISKYGFRGPQDFLYTLYEWPKALVSSARGNVGQYLGVSPDALYEQWIKSGAANSTLARVMNPEAFTARLPKNAKIGDIVAESNFGTGTPLKVASLLSNTLEETTKLLGLQRAMRIEGLDKLPPAERERKWDEIVTELRNYAGSPDFARSGVDMRALNIVMPFTNPRWQGFLADFSRLNPFRQGNAKDAGAAWARLGTLVAAPAAGLAWWNLHTPENERDYYQIPKQDRERYFHIPLYADATGKPSLVDYGRGGYYFKNKDGVDIRGYRRIPKREFPGLVANTIEDFVGFAKANDTQSFGQLAANFTDNFASTASPISLQGDTAEERFMSAASGVNPAIRVPIEIGTNQNFFTGRDIVPEERKKASPELQYTESTPEFYKQVATEMPSAASDTLRSPAKLQHITEGMTGGFVRQFATPRLSPGNPAGETSPLLGRFYRSERVENDALMQGAKEAERGRADQRITEQELASKLAKIVESRGTPEAKQKVLTDAKAAGLLNHETVRYLKEELQDAQRGLNYEDRVVKRSYSIAGGYRAKYFLDKLASIPANQRNAYLQEQANKGLLTKDVANQMRAMAVSP